MSLRDDPTVPPQHPADEPQQQPAHPSGRLGPSPPSVRLRPISSCSGTSPAATRRAVTAGSAPTARPWPLRTDRQGAAEHGHRITAAIACHVARAGGTVDQLTRLLLHPEHEGGRHARHIALRSGAVARPGLHPPGVGQCLGSGHQHATLDSRHDAYEVLAALRDRIETTPWRGERGRTALRVLRAHLNFAETAGGPLHHASERQTAEEAGISRTTLRAVYETVLKPQGWLRRLRVGHGREGSTWYLNDGSAGSHGAPASPSRFWTTQYPPDLALEEWPTPETATTADIDSTVIGRLMGHDAFAHHGLGSSALMIIGALHVQRPHQTVSELVGTSSVSRATAYRTLRRLAEHGLVHRTGETWALAPRALEGIGSSLADPDTDFTPVPAQGWADVAARLRHGGRRGPAQGPARGPARCIPAGAGPARGAPQQGRGDRPRRRSPGPGPRATPRRVPPAWHTPDGRVLDPVTGRAARRLAGRHRWPTDPHHPCRPAQLRRAGCCPCRSPQ